MLRNWTFLKGLKVKWNSILEQKTRTQAKTFKNSSHKEQFFKFGQNLWLNMADFISSSNRLPIGNFCNARSLGIFELLKNRRNKKPERKIDWTGNLPGSDFPLSGFPWGNPHPVGPAVWPGELLAVHRWEGHHLAVGRRVTGENTPIIATTDFTSIWNTSGLLVICTRIRRIFFVVGI